MQPTRAQVKSRFQNILDDPSGQVFGESVFADAFGEAYDALFTAFLTNQCPRIELITTFTLPPGTTSSTPATMGVADFGDFVYLAERTSGSINPYRDMMPVDRLPQRAMGDRLLEFNYRNDTFYFVGANQPIDLQLTYDSSGEAPTNDATQIAVDGCLTFLANYAVGVAGGRKGYEEIAGRCMSLAVGPKYDAGTIGGELFRIVQARVRSRQKVQIAPRPFSAYRRLFVRRAVPFVAAQGAAVDGSFITLPVSGTLAIGNDLAPIAQWSRGTYLSQIVAAVKQAPVGAAISIRIDVGGSFYTSLTIPDGQTHASTPSGALAALPAMPANATISLDLLTVGTTFPGSDLSVFLYQ